MNSLWGRHIEAPCFTDADTEGGDIACLCHTAASDTGSSKSDILITVTMLCSASHVLASFSFIQSVPRDQSGYRTSDCQLQSLFCFLLGHGNEYCFANSVSPCGTPGKPLLVQASVWRVGLSWASYLRAFCICEDWQGCLCCCQWAWAQSILGRSMVPLDPSERPEASPGRGVVSSGVLKTCWSAHGGSGDSLWQMNMTRCTWVNWAKFKTQYICVAFWIRMAPHRLIYLNV